MKVYAEFLNEGLYSYRKTTLLQFGQSWNLIGSAVLKNPGSALPCGAITYGEQNSIKCFFGMSYFDERIWFQFHPDQTMWILAKIFSGAFIAEKKELNGVIQLFNLSNYREQDILLAEKGILNSESPLLFPSAEFIASSFQNRPVYLGWFDFWKVVPQTKDIAEQIFSYVEASPHCYFDTCFESSKFYHPLYVNRAHKRLWVKNGLERFSKIMEMKSP